MVDSPQLPRPLEDASHWLGVIEAGRWDGVDDWALFPALASRSADVDVRVVAGIVKRILSLAAEVARSAAGKGGLSDPDDVLAVQQKVLHDVNVGIALPRSGVGRGLTASFFGRVVNIAAGEVRKRWRRRLRLRPDEIVDIVWIGGRSPDAPDHRLMREDVRRALDVLATPDQRRAVLLLVHAWTVPEAAAIEGVAVKTIHNRIKAFVRLYHG